MIALIDYRAGNLTSVKKALAAVGADVCVPARPDDLARARGIIVPGVGHFGATRALSEAWVTTIRARVDEGCPLLGICLGMQWLYETSDEAPEVQGLGIFAGRCYRLAGEVRLKADATYAAEGVVVVSGFLTAEASAKAVSPPAIKVPHVGWNSLTIIRDASIVQGVPSGAQVYFTHSYVGPIIADTAAVTEHGERFAAIVQRGRVAGVQFHPEKSGDVGLRILANFLRFCAE